MARAEVLEQGKMGAGLSYFRVGAGRPLVYLPGLTTHHRQPQGMDRWFQLGQVRPYCGHREVWWVQRPEGLSVGATIPGMADKYAAALDDQFDAPVDVVGSSTGGGVALQLVADYPDVARRLVLLSSGCRLGASGRVGELSLAADLRQGRIRQANARMMSMLAGSSFGGWMLGKFGWLFGPAIEGDGLKDVLVTIEAEIDWDLTSRLPGILTPTLVVGGGRDRFYGADVFRDTAAGLRNGRLLLYPGKGHAGAQTARETITEVLRFLDEQ